MEDDLYVFENGRSFNLFLMEDNLKLLENGRQPKKNNQKQSKVKTMVVAPLRVT